MENQKLRIVLRELFSSVYSTISSQMYFGENIHFLPSKKYFYKVQKKCFPILVQDSHEDIYCCYSWMCNYKRNVGNVILVPKSGGIIV